PGCAFVLAFSGRRSPYSLRVRAREEKTPSFPTLESLGVPERPAPPASSGTARAGPRVLGTRSEPRSRTGRREPAGPARGPGKFKARALRSAEGDDPQSPGRQRWP
ncbi:hypothetical protein P7K49_007958, partial [Saguinus oedipus]